MQPADWQRGERFAASAGNFDQVSLTASVIVLPGTNTSHPNAKPDAPLPTCLRGAPVRAMLLSPRVGTEVQAHPVPSGGCWAAAEAQSGCQALSQTSWFKSRSRPLSCEPPQGLGLADCAASSGQQGARWSTPSMLSPGGAGPSPATTPALPDASCAQGRRPRLQPGRGGLQAPT